MARTSKASAKPVGDANPVNVAPKGSTGPSSETPTPGGKSIFLFSDGTGNSSAKLFKTNVWRMYEAVDLGLASPGKHVQIAYYDNGVGTSNFRPLALLGGIFGIGLKANVLRLYTFLCRNYQPGDRIHAFGFSRGAFTIRLLVGLIVSQGIIKTGDHAARPDERDENAAEEPLAYQVQDAYRAFCGEHLPNRWPARIVAKGFRAVRNALVTAKRKLSGQNVYAKTVRHHTNVDFVGVWDTVAAYGGPFAEFTRGIDDWVWPLSMPHYGLSPKVLKARHALALDDERDAFHPLLWDEVREKDLLDHGGEAVIGQNEDGTPIREMLSVADDRLRQVWFTGVHSDVGGGYPDESLSYISLLWMMDELSPDPNAPTVDFVHSFVQRARDLANPFGPIHDSRSGLGAYYRYQPRKSAAMLDYPDHRTKSLRDPLVSHGFTNELASRERNRAGGYGARIIAWLRKLGRHRPLPPERGLLRTVQVHESAIARIISGIDDYAPAALPAGFEIVCSAKAGPTPSLSHADQAKLAAAMPAGFEPVPSPRSYSMPLLTDADHAKLAKAKPLEESRASLQEATWGRVWQRRVTYFATVGATLALITLPFHNYLDDVEALCSDDRCFAKNIVTAPIFFAPQSIREYVASWAEKPLLLIVLVVVIFGLAAHGRNLERKFRGEVRSIWKGYLAGNLTDKEPTFWRRRRESFTYQDTLYLVKWHLLPFVFGMLTLAALILMVTALASQFIYALAEPRQQFCANRMDEEGQSSAAAILETTDPCLDLKVNVERNRLYIVDALVKVPWEDGGLKADPARGVVDVPLHMRPLATLKRVTSANWFEPLTEVRTHDVSDLRRALVPIIGHQIDIRRQPFVRSPIPNFYQGLFCPRRSGHLYMMVNDAAPLLSLEAYENNVGSAVVQVVPIYGDIGRCDPDRISEMSPDRVRTLLNKLATTREAAEAGAIGPTAATQR